MRSLGTNKIAALPPLHTLSGADKTGSVAGKGKATWWKAFKEASQYVITALANLGANEPPSAETLAAIEKLICKLYVPNTTITSVKDLTVMVANYQAMVWNNNIVPQPQLPSPDNFGWKLEDNKWFPVIPTLPPAPEAVIQLVKCGCATKRCSTNRCQCRKANLSCTDLCSCCDRGDICENSHGWRRRGCCVWKRW